MVWIQEGVTYIGDQDQIEEPYLGMTLSDSCEVKKDKSLKELFIRVA